MNIHVYVDGFVKSFTIKPKFFLSKSILNATCFDENQNDNKNNNYKQFDHYHYQPHHNYNQLYTIIWYDCVDCIMLLNDMKKMHMNFEYIDICSNLIINKKVFAKLNHDETKPIFLLNQEYFGSSLFEMYEKMFLINKLLE